MATVAISNSGTSTKAQNNPKMGAWISDDIDKRPFKFKFTMDAEKISRARYIVFADNTEEAVLKVCKMIGEPTNSVVSSVGFRENAWIYDKETDASDITVGYAIIQGNCTPREVIDYVKKNGSLKLPYRYWQHSGYREESSFTLRDRGTQEKFWEAGIHMDMNDGFRLSHDPKRAIRQRASHRAAKTSAAKKASILKISDIYTAIRAFDIERYHINDEKYGYRFKNKTRKSHDHFCKLFLASVDYFNFHYGKNAHRKTVAFQDIVARWKKTPEKQRESFGERFTVWMEEEMKHKPVKKGKLKQKSNTLSALICKKMEEKCPTSEK
jgi:hypothetical protein